MTVLRDLCKIFCKYSIQLPFVNNISKHAENVKTILLQMGKNN